MDAILLKSKIQAAHEQLGIVERELDTALQALKGSTSSDNGSVAHLVTKAVDRLQQARLLVADLSGRVESKSNEAPPAEQNCPWCGKSIRAAATVCGYCWKKQSPRQPGA
jgi:hypothetical protein